MKIKSLQDLFVLKLQALYDIESELVKALPVMAESATDAKLKKSFRDHLKETEGHVMRLESIFEDMDMKPSKTKVEGIRGIIKDAEWIIGKNPPPTVLDAALIASARYAEHYEMAGYTSACAWAELLGYDEAVELLEMTYEEEKKADGILGEAAETNIFQRAAETGTEMDEDA